MKFFLETVLVMNDNNVFDMCIFNFDYICWKYNLKFTVCISTSVFSQIPSFQEIITGAGHSSAIDWWALGKHIGVYNSYFTSN